MDKEYNNLTMDNLIRTEWINQFDEYQIRKIKQGLRSKVDISWYAKKEFTWPQMDTIFKGLAQGIDVSIYAKPEISAKQMIRIREQLLKESTL